MVVGVIASAVLAANVSAAPKVTTTLSSARVNAAAGTASFPLFEGTSGGKAVFYVVTDSSNRADAKRRGVNWAPRLARALGTKAVQNVTLNGDRIDFPGTVDFSPPGKVVPGPTGFPPKTAEPGAVGDANYSPFVTTGDGIVLNATQVANDSGQSGSVVSITPDKTRVTLRALTGFFLGKRVLYLRTDASVPVVAALEASTYAPNLNAVPGLGSNAARSGRSAIIPVVNGIRGKKNPRRQGLQSAVFGEGSPLNITQSFPNAPDYSPAWDVTPVVWTNAAIKAGKRTILTSSSAIAARARAGELTSAGAGPANGSLGGIKALGGISNCTTIAILG
ncbi:MAG: hypothetical protein HYX33_01150 [Actinobacteria bacterium]|nr:hypothetical protein [Actinomycetota bacterium]